MKDRLGELERENALLKSELDATLEALIAARSASAGEAGTATTPQSGVVHEHATREAGDAQGPKP